jgi:hypothetical protein
MKIRELLRQGARIYGPPPSKSPSLENYPSADEEIREISLEIWGKAYESTQIHKEVGKGQLFYGQDLSNVLNELNVDPDIIVQDTSILWTHRRLQGTDIYFISNQEARSKEVELSFRIDNKIPEIWDPASGVINKMANFLCGEGRTKLPLILDKHGSVFVVFRESVNKPFIQNVTYTQASGTESEPQVIPASITYSDKGKIIMTTSREGKYTLSISDREDRPDHDTSDSDVTTIEVTGIPESIKFDRNWNVRFPENWDVPTDTSFNDLISWTDHPHEGIRHFSGTASYSNTFNISKEMMQPDLNVLLDLGEVMVTAEIIVNGKNLGIFWKKPFLVDITTALQAGNNEIEIRITNTWWNRLVGDEKYPNGFPGALAEQPRTYTTYKAWKANDELIPSGLLGPVHINFKKRYIISVRR